MRAKLMLTFGTILVLVVLGRPYIDKFIANAGEVKNESAPKILFLVEGLSFPEFREVTNDGQVLTLPKGENTILYIEFWATWCAPCHKEIPKLVELYKKYKDRGFHVIGINLDDNKEKALTYSKEQGVSWPQLFYRVDGFQSNLFKSFNYPELPPYLPFDFVIENGTLKETNLTADGLKYYLEATYK